MEERKLDRLIKKVIKETINDNYNPRYAVPKVRGGWNKKKILKYLKCNASLNGVGQAVKLIAEFDNVQDLKSHIFWHGSQQTQRGLKPSVTFPKNWDANLGGGGYGDRYWGVSVTSRKKTASIFTLGRNVVIHPIILAKDANVIRREDITDAADLNGSDDDMLAADNNLIVELYEQGVDAIYLGPENYGENELLVINPKAICNVDCPSYYNVKDNITPEKTNQELQELLDFCKEWRDNHTRQPAAPKKPHEPYNIVAAETTGEYSIAKYFIGRDGKITPREEVEFWYPDLLKQYDAFAKKYNEYQQAKQAYEEANQKYNDDYQNYLKTPEYMEYQRKLSQLRQLLKSI